MVTTQLQGTHCYTAPEALQGVISLEGDMYSFGVVLLECLTGLSAVQPMPDQPSLVLWTEELLDEESALWKAKVRMLAKYAKAYARKYGGVDEEEEEETKPAAR